MPEHYLTHWSRYKRNLRWKRNRNLRKNAQMELSPQELQEARLWLSELEFGDMEPEDFQSLPDDQIEQGIASFYEGGIPGFKASMEPLTMDQPGDLTFPQTWNHQG